MDGYLANTKWCKKPHKWLKPWHMGTHLRVFSGSFPMYTNMTGFRRFSKKNCVLLRGTSTGTSVVSKSTSLYRMCKFKVAQIPSCLVKFLALRIQALYIIWSLNCLVSDLGRMYQLVSRIQDGLGQLKILLESHIFNQGLAAIEKCGETALNVSFCCCWKKSKNQVFLSRVFWYVNVN